MTLGKRICALRMARNMSQGDLAETLDVSRQSVSKWENDAAVPDLDKLIRMCALFDVSMDELVLGKKRELMPAKAPSDRSWWTLPRIPVGALLMIFGALALVILLAADKAPLALTISLPALAAGLTVLLVRKFTALASFWAAYAVLFIWFWVCFNRIPFSVLSGANDGTESALGLMLLFGGLVLAIWTSQAVITRAEYPSAEGEKEQ